MKKNISLSIAILLAFYLVFVQNDPWRHISPDKLYTAIVSTDGSIVPGHSQDFLVNLFKNTDNQRSFSDHIKASIKLKMQLTDGTTKEDIVPLSFLKPGKFICSYLFPENLEETNVEMVVFPGKRTDKPILTCTIPVKNEKAIVIKEPDKQIYTGDNIHFELASVEKATSFPLFKTPIRVKLIAPSGFTTINRIVTTDTDGLATFETNIHPSSPEGTYTFVFLSDNFEQKVSVNIKDKSEKLSANKFPTVYELIDNPNENSGFIFNLNCEPQGSLMAYGCTESEHRQIEIWQNGKLQYYSNLKLEGGTVSLILQKPLLAGCPVLFKVWQINKDKITSHEKVRYLPPHQQNRASLFLKDVNSEFQNTERDRLSIFLSRKGYIAAPSNISIENLTKISSPDLKAVFPAPSNEIPISYYEEILLNDEKSDDDQTEFYLAEHEFSLKGMNKCTVLLDTPTFLTHYLKKLSGKKPCLDNLLKESVCRADRFQYLDLQEQNDELEKLEGLLIPISEIYSYLNKFPQKKAVYSSQILSCVNKIKNIIFIPAEYTFDISKEKEDNLYYLPMLDIKPVSRSLQSIQGLLKPTGKILLKKDDKTSELELNNPEINISSKDCDSITNLRSTPLIIEVN